MHRIMNRRGLTGFRAGERRRALSGAGFPDGRAVRSLVVEDPPGDGDNADQTRVLRPSAMTLDQWTATRRAVRRLFGRTIAIARLIRASRLDVSLTA